MYKNQDFWKNYMVKWFGEELIAKWENNVVIKKIPSNDMTINLEILDTGNKNKPTIIMAHGIAGYARVLLPFTMPLFEEGFNIISPDLQGYGYNDGLKGNFEWNAHKTNLKDTIDYAKKHYSGKIIIAGASMGGPLAYATACEKEVDAVIGWCLWDFNDSEFMKKETTTKQFSYMLIPIFKLLSKVFYKLRIKTYSLISYDTLTASQEFNDLLKTDPQAGTLITLKGAISLLTQSKPSIPHEDFTIPVLTLQPENDMMTPKYYSEKVSCKFAKNIHRYVEVPNCQHFPLSKEPYIVWTKEVSGFIRQL
ncbi:MAG: alpha/beta fold hydrolase [Clostridiales bacterium]|nr:alpha/beta fold hydrolase [Clostridiales bacterium]